MWHQDRSWNRSYVLQGYQGDCRILSVSYTHLDVYKRQVHGWRKYDMSQAISTAPFTPLQLPEAQLVLNGQVKSTILKNKLKDIALSVIVKKDDQFITGGTVTDENGRFTIPVEDFEGTTEAVIQTRKVGKERNKDASILICLLYTSRCV